MDLTPAQVAEATMQIAVLRGLYGDLGDLLEHPERRIRLWLQIECEHDRLGSIVVNCCDDDED
jgi:hypothetical protein